MLFFRVLLIHVLLIGPIMLGAMQKRDSEHKTDGGNKRQKKEIAQNHTEVAVPKSFVEVVSKFHSRDVPVLTIDLKGLFPKLCSEGLDKKILYFLTMFLIGVKKGELIDIHCATPDYEYQGMGMCSCIDMSLACRVYMALQQANDILKKHDDKIDSLVHVSFGAGNLLQTYLLVRSLFIVGYNKITVVAIDTDLKEQTMEIFKVACIKELANKKIELKPYYTLESFMKDPIKAHSFDMIDMYDIGVEMPGVIWCTQCIQEEEFEDLSDYDDTNGIIICFKIPGCHGCALERLDSEEDSSEPENKKVEEYELEKLDNSEESEHEASVQVYFTKNENNDVRINGTWTCEEEKELVTKVAQFCRKNCDKNICSLVQLLVTNRTMLGFIALGLTNNPWFEFPLLVKKSASENPVIFEGNYNKIWRIQDSYTRYEQQLEAQVNNGMIQKQF